jgi:hypothetical protein
MLIEVLDHQGNITQSFQSNAKSHELIELERNAYLTLTERFGLNSEEAKKFLNTLTENDMRSLWNIYSTILPEVKKVLGELMEVTSGNFQMVKDLAQFETEIWGDRQRAWDKYQIATYQSFASRMASSIVTEKQSGILLRIPAKWITILIDPLKASLVNDYKAKHPGEQIIEGRDIEKFKEFAFISAGRKLPSFMSETTIFLITRPLSMSSTGNNRLSSANLRTSQPNPNLVYSSTLLLLGDFMLLLLALGILLSVFAKPCLSKFWKKKPAVKSIDKHADSQDKIVLLMQNNL